MLFTAAKLRRVGVELVDDVQRHVWPVAEPDAHAHSDDARSERRHSVSDADGNGLVWFAMLSGQLRRWQLGRLGFVQRDVWQRHTFAQSTSGDDGVVQRRAVSGNSRERVMSVVASVCHRRLGDSDHTNNNNDNDIVLAIGRKSGNS